MVICGLNFLRWSMRSRDPSNCSIYDILRFGESSTNIIYLLQSKSVRWNNSSIINDPSILFQPSFHTLLRGYAARRTCSSYELFLHLMPWRNALLLLWVLFFKKKNLKPSVVRPHFHLEGPPFLLSSFSFTPPSSRYHASMSIKGPS